MPPSFDFFGPPLSRSHEALGPGHVGDMPRVGTKRGALRTTVARQNTKIINKMQTHHSPCDIRRATWDHNALNPQDPLLPMPRGHVIVRHAVTLHLHGPATTKTQCAAAGAGWQGTSRLLLPTSSPLVKSYPMVCQKVFRVLSGTTTAESGRLDKAHRWGRDIF